MTQMIVDIPDDLIAKIDDAVVRSIAENQDQVIIKALRFYLGGR